MGLSKEAGGEVRRRASSPKLLVLNTALATAVWGLAPGQLRQRPELWGRLVESAVGAHLANGIGGTTARFGYWRDRGYEVDYVLAQGDQMVSIEVKSSRRHDALPGMQRFRERFAHAPPVARRCRRRRARRVPPPAGPVLACLSFGAGGGAGWARADLLSGNP